MYELRMIFFPLILLNRLEHCIGTTINSELKLMSLFYILYTYIFFDSIQFLKV